MHSQYRLLKLQCSEHAYKTGQPQTSSVLAMLMQCHIMYRLHRIFYYLPLIPHVKELSTY